MLKDIEDVVYEEYPIMYMREQVGVFIEDMRKGYLITTMKLFEGKNWPIVLKVLQEDGIINYEKTLKFIKRRVTPPYQEGIEEKLKEMGLKEYNAYLIFRTGNGFRLGDYLWFDFVNEYTFDAIHTNACNVK